MSVEIDGIDDLVSRFSNIAFDIDQAVGDGLQEIGNSIVNNAQANAPVRTGNLRDSISITESSDTSITITAAADYSGFVEYGTRYMSAQPFMGPALDEVQSEISSKILDALGAVLI